MAQSPDTAEASDEYTRSWGRVQELIRAGQSWSGKERNCVFLNTGEARFADASAVTGLDFTDDGRGLAPVDWDADGDLDLWITNRSGPRVRFMLNTCDNNERYVAFKLLARGRNRDAIGAEVEVHLVDGGERRLVRTLKAGSGFISQASKWVHFGLPEDSEVGHVTVRWPGGELQRFNGCMAGSRWVLSEGQGPPVAWQRASPSARIDSGTLPQPRDDSTARVPVITPLPLLGLRARDASGEAAELVKPSEGATLLIMWAEWCANCKIELKELAAARAQIEAAGIRVVAVNVDEDTAGTNGGSFLQSIAWPFDHVTATPELLSILSVAQRAVLSRPKPELVPTSYLLDEEGALLFIYRGAAKPERLIADAALPAEAPHLRRERFQLHHGWWPNQTVPNRLRSLAINLRDAGHPELAAEYLKRLSLSAPHTDIPEIELNKIFAAEMNTATALLKEGALDEATSAFGRAVKLRPNNAEANKLLGVCLQKQGDNEAALPHLRLAARENPKDAETRNDLGLTLAKLGRPKQAGAEFQAAARLDPQLAKARLNLGVFHAQDGKFEIALTEVTAALELSPEYVEAWATLTQIHLAQGSLEDALSAANQASLAAKQKRADLIATQAQILLRLGRKTEAAELLPALEARSPERAAELKAALER